VSTLNETYGSDRVRFVQGDILECDLPPADLVILKDVLQHWPNDVIKRFLPRLGAFPHVLITNDNYECKRLNGEPDENYGYFRPLALLEPPFELRRATTVFRFGTDPANPDVEDKETLLLVNVADTDESGVLR
jgi:hypothetical protein